MFHPTEEMNEQTIGEFMDFADGLQEKGAIDEGEWKELLDIGMKLNNPIVTPNGRRSGLELLALYRRLMTDHARLIADHTGLRQIHLEQREFLEYVRRTVSPMVGMLLMHIKIKNQVIGVLGADPNDSTLPEFRDELAELLGGISIGEGDGEGPVHAAAGDDSIAEES